MRIGDKVKTIKGDIGTIIDKFLNDNNVPVYIVHISDDMRVKSLEEDLVLIEDEPEKKPDDKINYEELVDREFTITIREFNKILAKVACQECKDNFMLCLALTTYRSKVVYEIARTKLLDD